MLLSAATATMPNSVLWTVDLFGRVYTLSTAGQYWELCKDPQLEFKRVSAATQCCWGIACDNQIYVYVCSSDLPIRHREEAYENQVGSVCGWRGRWVCQEVEPPAPGFWPPPTFVSFISLTVRIVEGPECFGSETLLCPTKAGWPGLHNGVLQAASRSPEQGRAFPSLSLGALCPAAGSLCFGPGCCTGS